MVPGEQESAGATSLLTLRVRSLSRMGTPFHTRLLSISVDDLVCVTPKVPW